MTDQARLANVPHYTDMVIAELERDGQAELANYVRATVRRRAEGARNQERELTDAQ